MSTDDIGLAVARAVHIGCALLLVSIPFFTTLIWRPRLAERGRHDAFCRKAIVLLGALLVVEVLSGAAWLRAVTASMTDAGEGGPTWPDFDAVLTQTQFGLLWIVRAALAFMLGSLLAALAVGGWRRGGCTLAMWLALPLGTSLLASLAWAGHAASGVRWVAWHVFIDGVHLLAGAVWPLGLVPLAMFLVAARSRGGAMEEADRAIVGRYSRCAFVAVFAVVASGVGNSCLMLPSWGALANSAYGQWLLAKVFLVAVLIGLGALNRYRFLPALTHEATAAPRLLRTVVAESALALVVLLMVGAMGTTAPGK